MVTDGSNEAEPGDVEKAQTQSIYREVNERVVEISDQRPLYAPAHDAICECAKPECSEPITITAEEYERVRAHATWFTVAPSEHHVFPEIERIVEKNEGFWIVEKVDDAGAVAKELDPRAPQASPET